MESQPKRGPEAAWIVFAGANLALMVAFPHWTTIPFHFIWLSLILVHWYRSWTMPTALAAVAAVVVTTTGALLAASLRHAHGYAELAEVPLMAIIALLIISYASHRDSALAEVSRLARNARDFAQNLSHELRTPITIARGQLELLRADLAGSQGEADATVVLEELKRLSRISDQFLLLASSEHPDFLARTRVSLPDVIERVSSRWQMATDRDWQVKVVHDGRVLYADEERLLSALDALLDNAVKHTDEGDFIAIHSGSDRDVAVISVADSGRGIAPDVLPRIFERFYRGSARSPSGTGLGLAIVKAIVDAHAGEIDVESVPDRETRFTMRLPGLTYPESTGRAAFSPGFAGAPRSLQPSQRTYD